MTFSRHTKHRITLLPRFVSETPLFGSHFSKLITLICLFDIWILILQSLSYKTGFTIVKQTDHCADKENSQRVTSFSFKYKPCV